ncbi:MAG: hypothetical protein JWQ66_4167 [Mucilaginibacter sp.]|nr:hypothetical protein [Mucilaginibacter sp.]
MINELDMHTRVKEKQEEGKVAAMAASPRNSGSIVQLQDNRPTSASQKKQVEAMAGGKPSQLKPNNTGLPNQLKSGIENLSGHSMDDVKVHYNSAKPAQLNAHAYAQGTDIHIATGQEKLLPHEAWHVVQQKQGRVQPIMQMKGKVNINDDKGLEVEADVMGAKAQNYQAIDNHNDLHSNAVQKKSLQKTIIQPKWIPFSKNEMRWDKSRGGLIWYYNMATRTMRFEPDNSKELGDLGELAGTNQSYRAWIQEWKRRKYLNPHQSESLSFSAYIAHILETYPPGNFCYVGLGASCDIVLAYMKMKYNIQSWSIPVSGLTGSSLDEWTEPQKISFTNYIKGFVPEEVFMGSKAILVMDVTSGNSTLIVMTQLIQEIIKQGGGNINKVRSFSLNATIKPDKKFLASLDPKALSKSGPMDPASVGERKPSKQELSVGAIPAGEIVEQDNVEELDEEQQAPLKEKLEALEQELGKLKESPDKNKKEIRAMKKLVEQCDNEINATKPEFYPKRFDVMISDVNDIEKKLLDMFYKDNLGRSHRKVTKTEIWSGEKNVETEKIEAAIIKETHVRN